MSPGARSVWRPRRARDQWWLLATGAISILAQVLLLRELQIAFFGSELIYVLALGFWLLGTALGAAAPVRRAPTERNLCGLLLLLALLLPGLVLLSRGLRTLSGAMPGTLLGEVPTICGPPPRYAARRVSSGHCAPCSSTPWCCRVRPRF